MRTASQSPDLHCTALLDQQGYNPLGKIRMARHQTLIRSKEQPVAVIAHWEDLANGIRLRRLTEQRGPLPDHAHLMDPKAYFPDLDALKRAILAALHGPVGDTLDHVLLTPTAYQRWIQTIQQTLQATKTPINPDHIPNERAKALPDGRLKIWVDLPTGRTLKLLLPASDWAWRNGPPH
jgi:hypothetical protein